MAKVTAENGHSSPQQWCEDLAALPADPGALLAALRADPMIEEKGATQADRDFDGVTDALGAMTVVPPDVTAHLYQALATIPGVGIDSGGPPDVLGRPVLSVTYSGQAPWGVPGNQVEILLDPTTYAYVGIRETTPRAFSSGPGYVIPAGTTWMNSAVTSAVVDQPGQRP